MNSVETCKELIDIMEELGEGAKHFDGSQLLFAIEHEKVFRTEEFEKLTQLIKQSGARFWVKSALKLEAANLPYLRFINDDRISNLVEGDLEIGEVEEMFTIVKDSEKFNSQMKELPTQVHKMVVDLPIVLDEFEVEFSETIRQSLKILHLQTADSWTQE